MTDDQKKQLEEWHQRLPKCGCGRVARYETSTGLACNKYRRCDNAEFVAEQITSPHAQLDEMREEARRQWQAATDWAGKHQALNIELAEKDKEIERLREEVRVTKEEDFPRKAEAVAANWRLKLASAQAENLRLREYIESYLAANDPSEFGCACDPSVGHLCGPCFAEKQQRPLRQALSTPPDTSALAEYVARAGEVMRERCVEYLDGDDCFAYVSGSKAPGSLFSEAIRALPGVTIGDLK